VDALATTVMLRTKELSAFNLLDFLRVSHARRCVDERDRLFALYGMLSAESRRYFDPTVTCPVNYSKHFVVIYTNLAKHAVKAGLHSELLTHALMFGSLMEQNPAWSSWVPSWNRARNLGPTITSTFSLVDFSSRELEVGDVMERPTLRLEGSLDRITALKCLSLPSHGGSTYEYTSNGQPVTSVPHKDLLAMLIAHWMSGSHKTCSSMVSRLCSNSQGWMYGNLLGTSIEVQLTYQLMRKLLGVADLPAYFSTVKPPDDIDIDSIEMNSFQQEVDKALDGLVLFGYSIGDIEWPGLSYTPVKIGDCVLSRGLLGLSRRRGLLDRPLEYFVVRPCAYPETPEGITRSSHKHHRLLGGCLILNVRLRHDEHESVRLV
jgi:hypothetical protein